MIHYTTEEAKEMSKETARAEISNAVYEACSLFERLEGCGKVIGNGHHIRQQISKFATDVFDKRYED